MVVKFEVGKTYKYLGEIGDTSPFTSLGIDEQDALLIVSGKPLVCTYAEEDCHCPGVRFKGMYRENGGWAFISLYNFFDEVKEKTVAKNERKEKRKEMPKFEVGKTYRYTGSSDSVSDFVTIGIYECDAEHIVSGEPLTVEWCEHPRRIKFKEFRNPWTFLDVMLGKFEEVPATVVPYAERQAKWVKDNNIVHGSKVRLLRSYEPNEEGYVTEYPYAGEKIERHPVGQVFRVCYDDPDKGIVLAQAYDDFKYNVGNYFPYFVLEKVADDTPVYGERVEPSNEEVPAPSSEVDWEKKYAELEKRYHKLKDVAVEYMGRLSAESDGYKAILEVM